MKYPIFGVVLALAACSDQQGAAKHLAENGYTEIRIIGTGFGKCSPGDLFRTAFEATSPSGQPVRGTVCGDGSIHEEILRK